MTDFLAGDTPPQDHQVDRRAFLARMAALSAGAAVVLPSCGSGTARAGAGMAAPAAGALDLPADAVELTAFEAADLIRRRRLSPVELLDAYLARIDRLDGIYQAFNTVAEEEARAAARGAMEARPAGPLHGVPLAIKDNFWTAGLRTTANSTIFADFVPDRDATAVARLRAAGGIVLGKTQMGPLATTRATLPDGTVTTVNAWTPGDPSVSPGGSSTGTATAVAARMAPGGTGTQTGGSITVPADAQGLTGLKPTLGRVSLHGIIPLSYTRDHPGPLARDARDAALILSAMAGPDPADPRTLGLPPVPDLLSAAEPVRRSGRPALRWPTRIGVLPGYTDGDEPEAAARRAMLETFRELGAVLVEVQPPRDIDVLAGGAFNNVRLVERTEPFLEYLQRDVRLFGVSLSSWINGALMDADIYLKGQRAKLLLLERVLDELFADCDVVVQTSHLAFDIIGLPLISFPIGIDESGEHALPIGALFGGLPFGEERLLSIAAGWQQVTDWHRRRPPEPASGPGAGARSSNDRGRVRSEEVMDLTE